MSLVIDPNFYIYVFVTFIQNKLHLIQSVHAFPGKQNHDPVIVRATCTCLSNSKHCGFAVLQHEFGVGLTLLLLT